MGQTTFTNIATRAQAAYLVGHLPDANLDIRVGQPMALVQAAAVNGAVTFTVTGSPASGSEQFSWYGKTLLIAFNETAATLTTKLNSILGTGNFAVTGGAWPGTPLVVTAARNLAGLTLQLPVRVTSTFNTGSSAASMSTTAVPSGRVVAWDPTLLANPTAAFSVSATGTGGTLPVATVMLRYSWVTGTSPTGDQYETLAGPAAALALTSAQNIRVAAISAGNVPAGATGINVYMDGQLIRYIALSSGAVPQTDIASVDTTLSLRGLPARNTGYRFVDGRQILTGFAVNAGSSTWVGQWQPGPGGQGQIGSTGFNGFQLLCGGVIPLRELSINAGQVNEALWQLRARVLKGLIADPVTTATAEVAFGPYGAGGR